MSTQDPLSPTTCIHLLKLPLDCTISCFSHVYLFATLCTVACQAPLSMGFSRQECWSRLPFPSSGDPPDPGMEPASLISPALAGRFFTTGPGVLKDFIFFFLIWTIFKVFIEPVTILLLFYILTFWPWAMWDLRSLTRDRTRTLF